MHDLPPDDVLDAWFAPGTVRCTPLSGGLINGTWRVDGEGPEPLGVLQRVNGYVFKPPVNDDLDRVSQHLAAKGVPTPRLVPTRDGRRWLPTCNDDSWRVLTWLEGDCYAALPSHEHARSAGALVGRWHAATADLSPTFRNVRPGAHDTDRHLAIARQAVDEHVEHPLRDAVAPLIDALADSWARVQALLPDDLPTRVIHGDLKATNVRFGPDGRALALLDLDTCAASTLDIELGDMLRSWCASGLEDDVSLVVDRERFSATLQGYAQGSHEVPPTEAEWASLVPGTIRISTELGLRFGGDVLREAYFGWDRARFARAGEHHLLRTRAQLALSTDLWTHRDDLMRRLDAARATLETP